MSWTRRGRREWSTSHSLREADAGRAATQRGQTSCCPFGVVSRVLVTGTLAIDYVADYGGRFSELPRHPGVNLSIQLDRIARRFGGCAMNIACGLRRLGQDAVPFVFVGEDYGEDYRHHLEGLGIDLSGITRLSGAGYSSHAFVFTDAGGNQFTGFFPGPARVSDFARRLSAFVVDRAPDYAVLAPDIAVNMIDAARVMRAHGIPFLCDPGQGLTDFSAPETEELIRLSDALIVNQYEFETVKSRCEAELRSLECVVVTTGQSGSWSGDIVVPAVTATTVRDPTGCGDAYRTGFVDARLRGAGMRDAMRAGACAATINIEHEGTQSHDFRDYAERYRAAWDDVPGWLAAHVHVGPGG